MDEKRRQAYASLIEEFLNCPSGEEVQVLKGQAEFVDEGLVLACREVAEQLQEEGQEYRARFLRHIAQYLAESLDSSSDNFSTVDVAQTSNLKYFSFLMKVLQVTADSDKPKDLYPLLTQHQEKLDQQFLVTVKTWFRSEYDRDKPERNKSIGSVLHSFAVVIQQLPLGSRANNIEIAIACYEAVLEVFSREAFPEQWATIQNNLGNAYNKRIIGERAENIEIAIYCYWEALKFRTLEAFTEQWAKTQNNLGEAYRIRIRGDRAENIENAIACYREALKVYDPEAFSQNWAMTQNNLGNAYCDGIRGDRSENLELAIASYREALKAYSPEAFPQDWGMTYNNLAAAYSNRIRGERVENIEKAIPCYREALKVYTPEAFPEQWATTQNNLGNAYNYSIIGERAYNLEMAIACYREALKVFTREAFPEQWATIHNNLAAAYNYRIIGERAYNLEMAIASYREALKVRTPEAFPENWAVTQANLGGILIDRFEISHQEEDMERAIALYREVLDGYQQQSIKLDRPRIFYQLGKALSRRGSYPQAIQALEECRTLLEKKVDLSLLALAFFELARLYHSIHRLEKARLYYKDTLRLFRRLEDRESVADVAVALGNLELQIGRFEQAKERLEEVRNYYEAKDRQDRLEEIDRLLELLCKPTMAII